KTTPAAREHVLRWQGSAPYFDLVLWRDGKRILDSWPTEPQLQLPTSWTYAGKQYRLTPGTYLWFVYPGIGQRARSHYGPLAASGSLTIG
ncbi:MAG: hypothetical protein H0X39_19245, partial [Actinobacteria bacterium]|nr:hypothetical protein [Actinomycetota bacterium]